MGRRDIVKIASGFIHRRTIGCITAYCSFIQVELSPSGGICRLVA
ncbi:Hypothetical protein ETEE_1947 [Edwardsiella anguillarum ET080813]|uniref:Uncharacterized protein n=1 Tax=Edwardsiella anguillarum ET080813 TaxID=667120 RepID=A0A076LP38_9GAMM|nr:Hypothetical protein ETEE_1947 [Edwardsiella anguillarum ET080813]